MRFLGRRANAALLAGGLALGGLGLAGCHTTSPSQMCAETRPAGYSVLLAYNYTVVGGTPVRFACEARSNTNFTVHLCWIGRYDDHSIGSYYRC